MKTEPFQANTLYYGDCLEVMREWDGQSVDLIYLDPPFNSKANYNIIFGNKARGPEDADLAQMTAFADTWYWDENAQERVDNIKRAVAHPAHRAIDAFSRIYPEGSGMLSYLSYMAERVAEMPRLLRNSGSIYLHCDPTASHYLKLIMDEVFGAKNFRNEVVWCYRTGGAGTKRWATKHDILLMYAKDARLYRHNVEKTRSYIDQPAEDIERSYIKNALASGLEEGIKWWEYMSGRDKMRIYRDDNSGAYFTLVNARDWWVDLNAVGRYSQERLGYPTQKPLALLERIIQASSDQGDVVLDPFCGCGTTIHAAHNLKRKWLGIDISTYAIEVIRRERMRDLRIRLEGVPKDLRAAKHFAANNPFDFEKWAVTRLEGFAPNTVQRGDSGIDGRAKIFALEDALAIAQVKGGRPTVEQLKAFVSTLQGGNFALGIFITLEKFDTPTVKQWVGKAGKLEIGHSKFNRLVMWSLDEYFQNLHPKLPAMAHPRTGQALQGELPSDA
ncbi:MAG: DNA methyltransferase [Gammaproteobacteria bacterium]|nr:DNA methyltransferase [Gammaproteobacteria bacterium]